MHAMDFWRSEFIQIWHKRYEGNPGHRWLRDLVLDAVRPKIRTRASNPKFAHIVRQR
jgi:hypothetical protein